MEATHSSGAAAQSKPIVITRYFDLPLDTVWKAWSEPEEAMKWWGPKDFTCPVARMDFRTGGKYLLCMKDKDGKEYWSTGVYKEIIPHKKIVMSDSFSDPEGNIMTAAEQGLKGEWPLELLITLEFGESEGRSSLWLKHEGVPPEMYDDCVQGWDESLDKLENSLK